jgi:glucosamine-6-phosphate deaminase
MEPLGRDLLNILPFREEQVCAQVRRISRAGITRREPAHHEQFTIRVIDEPADLYRAMAQDMLRRIQSAAAAGRPFVGVFPIGPVGQYPYLVGMANEQDVSLEHCQLFFMDEYAHEDGTWIAEQSPWSFRRTAQEMLMEPLARRGLRPEQVHFPGPDNVGEYDDMIQEASEGRGADVVYGGIGWSGHFAFWEPHLWEQFAIEEAWRRGRTAFVRLHPLSILQNSLRAGGDWSSVLPCAYTVGPEIVLGAQWRSFWLDADLGRGLGWQRFIGRLATHGPVTPLVPASYLQTLPGEVIFLGAVAQDIAGPQRSWK